MKDQLMQPNDTGALIFVQNDGEISSFTEDTNIATQPTLPKKDTLTILPLIATLIFGIIYMLPFWSLYPIPHSCLALLISVAFLWSTEGLPAHATAYLVPVFGVWLNLGYNVNTGQRIPANELAKTLSWRFMDPIIFVFLGSMTMSAGLSKLQITDRVSRFFFKRLSKKPSLILLSLMYLNLLIAAFLSNVASTTLILTFSLPIIRSLDPDDPYITALLFGIAWSGNSGGMPTTIASPQNILAISYITSTSITKISFVEWMYFGVPVSILITFCEWLYLIYRFKPQRTHIVVGESEPDYPGWSIKHTYASLITILTILLWTLEETFPNILGNVGITSMIPLITFFGSGILNIQDFQNIKWSTLALMGGGLALGETMKMSGLLDLVSNLSGKLLEGIKLWPLLLMFSFFVGILGSLINSTSAAAILYPVIGIMGKPSGHSNLLVSLSAIMVSGGQLFHISSFPNALVSGTCRHILGNPDKITPVTFLKGSDYFIIGWPTLFISLFMVCTVGYFLGLAVHL